MTSAEENGAPAAPYLLTLEMETRARLGGVVGCPEKLAEHWADTFCSWIECEKPLQLHYVGFPGTGAGAFAILGCEHHGRQYMREL